MRAWLATAAALAVLAAVVLALWVGRSGRETERARRRVEDVVARVEAAAELAASGELAGEPRAAVPSAVPLSAAETAPAPAAEAELTVTVVADEDGRPLKGIPLARLPWPSQPLPEDFSQQLVTTDERGLATLPLAAGAWQVYTPTQEDRKLVAELSPGEKRAGLLRLRGRADLDVHLRVVDAHSEEPLAGAAVELECYTGEPVLGLWTARADADGAVALRVASWVAYRAHVSAEGYTAVMVGLQGAHADREHARRVALERAASLRGTVTDAREAPQVGVIVSAEAHTEGRQLDGGSVEELANLYWASEATSEGRYTLVDLPAGVDLELEVRRGGSLVLEHGPPLRLEPGEERVLDLRLDAGSIRGVVLDAAGAPVPRLDLWLASGSVARELNWFEDPIAQATTDGDGRFAFDGVPHGAFLVAPQPLEEPPPGAPMPLGHVVELPAGVPAVDVELRLPPALFIRGRCVDVAGEPVGGVKVSSVSIEAFASASAESLPDGSFELGPMASGEVVLFAQHEALCLEYREFPRARAGDAGVVLTLLRAASVCGTVVDASSGARVGAEVVVFAGQMFTGAATAGTGGFELAQVPPGRCVLVARTSPALVSAPRTLDLEPGGKVEVELQVAPGGWVRVLLPEGQAWARLLVGEAQVGWLDRGAGTTAIVPPGPLTIELRNLNGLLASKQVAVAAGETLEVDLR